MEEPERKRRGPLMWLAGRSRRLWDHLNVGQRITAGVALTILYFASFAPINWCLQRGWIPKDGPTEMAVGVYALPAGLIHAVCPAAMQQWMDWYFMMLVQ